MNCTRKLLDIKVIVIAIDAVVNIVLAFAALGPCEECVFVIETEYTFFVKRIVAAGKSYTILAVCVTDETDRRSVYAQELPHVPRDGMRHLQSVMV